MTCCVFCSSPSHDLALQRNVHNRVIACAAMYAIARPGLRLPMHISISCEQNTGCMLRSWRHEHAAAVLSDDTAAYLYGLQNAVAHYFQGVPLQNSSTEGLGLRLLRSCFSLHSAYACHTCAQIQEGDQPL